MAPIAFINQHLIVSALRNRSITCAALLFLKSAFEGTHNYSFVGERFVNEELAWVVQRICCYRSDKSANLFVRSGWVTGTEPVNATRNLVKQCEW